LIPGRAAMEVVDVRILFFLDTISDWADVGRRFFRAPLVEINDYMYESRMFFDFSLIFHTAKKRKENFYSRLSGGTSDANFLGVHFCFL
jgi:hypothetical protein